MNFMFYSLPLLQFVDVPEDWCKSATEFTKEEKIIAFRNCTCRSRGDTEIVSLEMLYEMYENYNKIQFGVIWKCLHN